MEDYIDIYCERVEPGLWAEPLNAVTNAAFFMAAFMVFLLARKQDKLNAQTVILIGLIIIIGTGSTLFHTTATFWAMMADSLPILFYQIAFLTFFTRDVLHKSWRFVAGILGAFALTIFSFYQLPQNWLNGSINYIPALLFLMILAFLHYKKLRAEEETDHFVFKIRESCTLVVASVVFIISLHFRSFDIAMCDALPFGTHFAWHILNGVVLYLTTRAYILNNR